MTGTNHVGTLERLFLHYIDIKQIACILEPAIWRITKIFTD
jgi:hypothetical protein